MNQHSITLRVIRSLLLAVMLITGLLNLGGCANFSSWKEEARLLDGRVIEIDQKRRLEKLYGRWYARESWLTVSLPETGNRPVTWQAEFEPRILNVIRGRVYIVGMPFRREESAPDPPYVGYVLERDSWKPVAFSQIPEEIYDMNLSFNGFRDIEEGWVTLSAKPNGSEYRYLPKPFKRIDPQYRFFPDRPKP